MTPDLNDDLASFIAKYAKAYDPLADIYRRPSFASPVKAGKATPIYNAHSYHTKVPPKGIEPYIAHYTDPGDIVLDPFCGSGMTGVAALELGRHVILNDLSPAAAHISYNYCTPVNLEALKHEFERIKFAVKDEFGWLYGTICDRCGGPATIQYTIWSDVFDCDRCSFQLILWDLAVDRDAGKVRDSFICPNCGKEQTKIGLHWRCTIPVVTYYDCQKCKPKRSNHPISDSEGQIINQIDSENIPYWYPITPFNESREMWRGIHGVQSITDISKFYTKRNLKALARIWYEIQTVEEKRLYKALQFVFTGAALLRTTKMARVGKGPNGGLVPSRNLSGTLYIASISVEKNVWDVFANKADMIFEILRDDIPYSQPSSIIKIGSATDLQCIPESIIDYIFTDPPFGSNIFYSDCNLIWESWLGQITDEAKEAVVHVKHKDKNTLPDYARLMAESFREMYRVLKPNRWASVVFHNSDDKIWQVILDAVASSGFELAEINSFDKEQLSFKGIRGAKGLERVTNKDIVLNLLKPDPLTSRQNGLTARNDDAEARIVQQIADFIATDPQPEQRTLQHFWNVVLYDMLASGQVDASMEKVGNMLPYYFKQVDGRWYLRGEAVIGGNVFDIKSDTGAISWLTAVLSNLPQTTGDLIPKWQQVTADSGMARDVDPGRLERLLGQNFWVEKRSNRWRIPTEIERRQMSATENISTEAHLRVIRRFLNGENVNIPSTRELGAWIQFAYQRKAYAEAVEIYRFIDESQLDPEYVKLLRKMVQVSQLKVGKP